MEKSSGQHHQLKKENMKQLTFLIIILSAFNSHPALAQHSQPTDTLILQLQKLSDSTIFYEASSNWAGAANYYILSKKSDTVNAFTYRDLAANHGGDIIRGLKQQMLKPHPYKIMFTIPAINQYFNFHPLPKDQVSKLWKQMLALNPWSIGDDAVNGIGCPRAAMMKKIRKDGKSCTIEYTGIYDGGELRIYLITKGNIKVLNYYAPDYYETFCPGRTDRIAALKIESLFKKHIL
jgi:hypothetical protein